MKRFIFLDIDGVLNSCNLRERQYVPGTKIIGVEDKPLRNLKKVYEAYQGLNIILVSTWKFHWSVNKSEQGYQGNYLDMRFSEYGMSISDKSEDEVFNRGAGIKTYLSGYIGCKWVVIDDCVAADYDTEIKEHLVQTDYKIGLSGLDAGKAIEILK